MHFQRKIDLGRTMVEMVGVLAVMGVLTVLGLEWYDYAVSKIRANDILDSARKRVVFAYEENKSKKFEQASLVQDVFTNSENTTSYGYWVDEANLKGESRQSGATVEVGQKNASIGHAISKTLCHALKAQVVNENNAVQGDLIAVTDGDGNNDALCDKETNTVKLVFKLRGTPKQGGGNPPPPNSPCKCESAEYVGGICCKNGYKVVNSCEDKTLNPSICGCPLDWKFNRQNGICCNSSGYRLLDVDGRSEVAYSQCGCPEDGDLLSNGECCKNGRLWNGSIYGDDLCTPTPTPSGSDWCEEVDGYWQEDVCCSNSISGKELNNTGVEISNIKCGCLDYNGDPVNKNGSDYCCAEDEKEWRNDLVDSYQWDETSREHCGCPAGETQVGDLCCKGDKLWNDEANIKCFCNNNNFSLSEDGSYCCDNGKKYTQDNLSGDYDFETCGCPTGFTSSSSDSSICCSNATNMKFFSSNQTTVDLINCGCPSYNEVSVEKQGGQCCTTDNKILSGNTYVYSEESLSSCGCPLDNGAAVSATEIERVCCSNGKQWKLDGQGGGAYDGDACCPEGTIAGPNGKCCPGEWVDDICCSGEGRYFTDDSRVPTIDGEEGVDEWHEAYTADHYYDPDPIAACGCPPYNSANSKHSQTYYAGMREPDNRFGCCSHGCRWEGIFNDGYSDCSGSCSCPEDGELKFNGDSYACCKDGYAWNENAGEEGEYYNSDGVDAVCYCQDGGYVTYYYGEPLCCKDSRPWDNGEEMYLDEVDLGRCGCPPGKVRVQASDWTAESGYPEYICCLQGEANVRGECQPSGNYCETCPKQSEVGATAISADICCAADNRMATSDDFGNYQYSEESLYICGCPKEGNKTGEMDVQSGECCLNGKKWDMETGAYSSYDCQNCPCPKAASGASSRKKYDVKQGKYICCEGPVGKDAWDEQTQSYTGVHELCGCPGSSIWTYQGEDEYGNEQAVCCENGYAWDATNGRRYAPEVCGCPEKSSGSYQSYTKRVMVRKQSLDIYFDTPICCKNNLEWNTQTEEYSIYNPSVCGCPDGPDGTRSGDELGYDGTYCCHEGLLWSGGSYSVPDSRCCEGGVEECGCPSGGYHPVSDGHEYKNVCCKGGYVTRSVQAPYMGLDGAGPGDPLFNDNTDDSRYCGCPTDPITGKQGKMIYGDFGGAKQYHCCLGAMLFDAETNGYFVADRTHCQNNLRYPKKEANGDDTPNWPPEGDGIRWCQSEDDTSCCPLGSHPGKDGACCDETSNILLRPSIDKKGNFSPLWMGDRDKSAEHTTVAYCGCPTVQNDRPLGGYASLGPYPSKKYDNECCYNGFKYKNGKGYVEQDSNSCQDANGAYPRCPIVERLVNGVLVTIGQEATPVSYSIGEDYYYACCLNGKKWVGGPDGDYSEDDVKHCGCPTVNGQVGTKHDDKYCCGADNNLLWDGSDYTIVDRKLCGCPKDSDGNQGENKNGTCCLGDKEWHNGSYEQASIKCPSAHKDNKVCQ